MLGKRTPHGLTRLLFRLPILLYRLGLGALLGRRFVLLEHRGRHSGEWHQTVLEVIGEQRQRGVIYVVSAWGERSDWLRNLRRTPQVQVQIGSESSGVRAEPLEPSAGAEVLRDYAERHPIAARELVGLFGYKLDDPERDFDRLVEDMVVVALQLQE